MDDSAFKELEVLIQQELEKVPAREAPENLISEVFQAIAAREARRWWQRPYHAWPRIWQAVLFLALIASFSLVVALASEVAGYISGGAAALMGGWARPVLEAGAWAASLGNQLWLAVSNLGYYWYLIVAIVGVIYFGSVAAGVALYRIAFQRDLQTS